MKKLILLVISILFMITQINVMAQCDLPFNEEGEYEVKEVVTLENSPTNAEIYAASMLAFAEIFKLVDDGIEVENEKLGYISGSFTVAAKPHSLGAWKSFYKFSLRLDFRESKYRMTVKYLSHHAYSSENDCYCPNKFKSEKCGVSCIPKGLWRKQKCEAHTHVLEIISKLKSSINSNLTGDDNW